MQGLTEKERKVGRQVIDIAIKLVILFFVVKWCFQILAPFVPPVLWGAIIAVAIYPLHVKLTRMCGGKEGRAALLFGVMTISLLIVPTIMVSGSMIDSVKELATELEDGQVTISPPSDSVAEWPFVGEKLHEFWLLASQNLESALSKIQPQLKELGSKLLGITLGGGLAVLQFIFAVIVASLFLANSGSCQSAAKQLATRLVGPAGFSFVDMASATIKSVAQGVLGIAFIQALLAGVGLVIMEVPGAGLWTLAVLFVAIVQLPPILILGPIIAYVFSLNSGSAEVVFAIYCVLVSSSDAFLKPILLGRGLDVPMLVILMGAIGGMLMSGIIGLFIGAVVLSVGYKLILEWLSQTRSVQAEEQESEDQVI